MIIIKRVKISEADTLLDFSKRTFFDFFAYVNDADNMETYSAVAFTHSKILAELSNPDSEFYFAFLKNKLVGYLKLNFNEAQTEFKGKNALEIERIYVLEEHHGQYIGKQLLDFTISIALKKKFEYVWLGVWDHNYKAAGFYKHNGFEVFSTHDFLLGNDRQTDLLMRKTLI